MNKNKKVSPTFDDHLKELESLVEKFSNLTKDLTEQSWLRPRAEICMNLFCANNCILSLARRSKIAFALMSEAAEATFRDSLRKLYLPAGDPTTIPGVIKGMCKSAYVGEGQAEHIRTKTVTLLSEIGFFQNRDGTRERIELMFGDIKHLQEGVPTKNAMDVVTTLRATAQTMLWLFEVALKV